MKLPAVLRTPPPHVAVEIGPSRVAAVAVAGTGPAGVTLAGWAVEPLPPGAVVPSLTASNVVSPADVEAALRRAWDRLGQHPRRVALVVPDAAAKVSIVRFKDVPSKASDLDELIKFQIRKATPFRIEDSQVSFTAGDRTADGQDFVVVQARRDLIMEYEQACAGTGAVAGVVDLATFGLAQCAIATGGGVTGDWLLIHAGGDGATIAIYRGRHLVFFRNRGASGDGHLSELVHQTAMYYQDRLGGRGFSRVFAGGATAAALASPVWTGIQERLGVRAEVLGAGSTMAVAARRALEPETADAITPALGAALSLWVEA